MGVEFGRCRVWGYKARRNRSKRLRGGAGEAQTPLQRSTQTPQQRSAQTPQQRSAQTPRLCKLGTKLREYFDEGIHLRIGRVCRIDAFSDGDRRFQVIIVLVILFSARSLSMIGSGNRARRAPKHSILFFYIALRPAVCPLAGDARVLHT